MSGDLLEAFERTALVLAAVLIAAGAILLSPQTAYSLTVGATLAAGNAVLINRVGRKMAALGKSPALLVVVFQLKLFLMVGLIFVAMRYLGVEALPFAFGVSILPVAVLSAGLFRKQLVSPSPSEEPHG